MFLSLLKNASFWKIAGVVVLLASMAFLYYRHTNLIKDNQALSDKLEKVEMVVKQREKEIDDIKANVKEQQRIVDEVLKTERDNRKHVDDLQEKFTKKDRDLGNLAEKKTGLVQPIIQRGADYRNRCFEIASGSPVTEEDKDNNVCPQLIDSDSH